MSCFVCVILWKMNDFEVEVEGKPVMRRGGGGDKAFTTHKGNSQNPELTESIKLALITGHWYLDVSECVSLFRHDCTRKPTFCLFCCFICCLTSLLTWQETFTIACARAYGNADTCSCTFYECVTSWRTGWAGVGGTAGCRACWDRSVGLSSLCVCALCAGGALNRLPSSSSCLRWRVYCVWLPAAVPVLSSLDWPRSGPRKCHVCASSGPTRLSHALQA